MKSNTLLDNPSFRLMSMRAGDITDDMRFENYHNNSVEEGIPEMGVDLKAHGGYPQWNRMVKDKRKSLDKALLYSYQSAFVKKHFSNIDDVDPEFLDKLKPVRALINPDKLKQDYDYKIISTGFENRFASGDVFEWCGTGTYWLIYLQELTEVAYFRGYITRCQYEISWEGGGHTYCSVKGPVETKINYIQKHGVSVDKPNYSLTILVPRNEDTLSYFKRYSKFYLKPTEEGSDCVCWRVEAIDWISTPGILEIQATEYYANEFEDDKEEGIVGALIVEPVDPNSQEITNIIVGETFIRPKQEYIYTYKGEYVERWGYKSKSPIQGRKIDDRSIGITWTSPYSGQFELKYGDITKTIIVESLF